MKLKNTRHELFAQALATGASQSDAYEKAGYKRSNNGASRLADNKDVQARLAELQARHAAQCDVTVESLSAEFDEIKELAVADGQYGPAVQALERKARLHGFLTTSKHELTGKDGAPIETVTRIERRIVDPAD